MAVHRICEAAQQPELGQLSSPKPQECQLLRGVYGWPYGRLSNRFNFTGAH